MIVKNEKNAIGKSLASVKNLIDYWVILDTGSTDGTQQAVAEGLKDVPGELHQSAWVDFAKSRNEALALAHGKADYVLFLDADEQLIVSTAFAKQSLSGDYYYVRVKTASKDIHRKLLIRDHPDWRWKGALHEQLLPPEGFQGEFLTSIENDARSSEGSRAKDPNKYRRDAQLLEAECKKDPSDRRAQYYLAQSYLAAEDYRAALSAYEKRAAQGGHLDEVFWSLFYCGRLRQALRMDPDLIVASHTNAYSFDSRHPEPLAALAEFFHQQGLFLLGYLVAQYGLGLPLLKNCDTDPRVADYYLLQKFAECAAALGQKEEAIEAFEQLIERPNFPRAFIPYLHRNLAILKNASRCLHERA